MIQIRPFATKDFAVLLDLANQAVPFATETNPEWLKYRQAFDDSSYIRRHYLALDETTPLGYGALEQQSDDPHIFRIYVVCSPVNLQGETGERLYATLLKDAVELQATRLWAREFFTDQPIRHFFTSRGFVENEPFTIADYPTMIVYELTFS